MALTTPSVSPAIVVKEIDLTGVSPNVETSLSGYVGQFKWGPVDVPTRIKDEGQLASVFGTPDNTAAVDYFSAAQYLRYSGNLIVNRQTAQNGVVGDSAFNATLRNQQPQIGNKTVWENTVSTEMFTAKYPGVLGNSLSVSIFSIANADSVGSAATVTNFNAWQWRDKFDGIPSTSDWAGSFANTVKNDEVHVAIIDKGGLISGTVNTVLEVFPYVSVALGAKTVDGGDNNIKSVLNAASNYVWFGAYEDSANMVSGDNWGTSPLGTTNVNYADGVSWSNDSANATMAGGTDSGPLSTGDYALGFDNFEDKDAIDVQILIAPGMATSTEQISVVNDLAGIASATRKDCVVVASPDRAAVVGNNTPTASTIVTTNQFSASNYLIVDNNYLRVYNKYADEYIFIPAASTTAGLLAATDANYGPWYSPAGERRGEYFGVTSLAYSPNKAERDELYKVGVNPIVQFAGRGILLFGDKTKQSRASAFDRINVRRLFLAVEKSVALAARNFMFEFNDEFTRSEFVAIVEPLLREIQARRGIEDFYVQCDTRNNTAEVRSRNELVASVFIKPAYAINFITLNFVATRAGLDFEEVIGTLS
jgi:phage tail sheath protein FI